MELPALSSSGESGGPACDQIVRPPGAAEQIPEFCIHHLFEQQVGRSPDRIAVEFADQQLTYRQLDERANQWARHLQSLGVGPATHVGICVERSLEMVIAIYAVLKTGGAYVPLDPHFPANRLAMILEDAAPVALITQRALALRCANFTGARFWIDEDFADRDTSALDIPVTAADAAYVIFTSGSTGRPKGVVLEHRSVVNFMRATRACPGLTAADVVLSVITFSFDMSVFDWFPPLALGARLVIAPDYMRSDGVALMDLIRTSGATMTHATPSIWKSLIQAGWQGQPGYKPLLGGEACSPDLARDLLARCDEIWNLYGPTETTVYSAGSRITKPEDIHIGTPVGHTHLHIVDESLRAVPAGTNGELLIGGRGLARGYLNQPELTAERFIPDPFSKAPGARLYRTGDLCHLRPDGNIAYLGRIDTQVKLNGFRIELGEIEISLRAIPGVQDAVVVLGTSGADEKHLTGFVVSAPEDAPLSDPELQTHLARDLPGYMIPARILRLAALPLTPNGKIDRRALASLDQGELITELEPNASHAATAQGLTEIWRDVLRRDQVDITDNFFDLGGHSLLAVLICARLSRVLGLTVPLRWIFEYPTIEQLLPHLENEGGASRVTEPITRQEPTSPAPASFAQQGMWLLHQSLAQPAAYNVASVWQVPGPLDRPRLQRSLQAMLTRHDILRISLSQQGNLPEQHVTDIAAITVPWREVIASASPSEDPLAAARQILDEELLRGFELTLPPLWRVICIGLPSGEHVLAFIFHHSIVDEWSLGLFAAECSVLYAANGSPEAAALPPPELQYPDYAAWQHRQLTSPVRKRLETYWQGQLTGLPPPLALPCTHPGPVPPSGRGASYAFALQGPLVTKLRQLARAEETTLFTVLLTAFQVWLHRVTGQNDVLVSTPMTRRNQPELMTLLGFFLNTLPIRTQVDGDLGFTEVLQRTRTAFTDAVDHADLPFEQIVALAAQPRSSQQSPLFQTAFVLTEEPRTALRLGEMEATAIPLPATTSKNDLTLFIDAETDRWNVRIEYATDLWQAEMAKRMAGQFTQLLESLVTRPTQAISRLPLLPEDEYQLVVETWNDTETPYPRDRCIPELFAEQVELTPDAPAIAFGDAVVTYRELNDTADRIASHLQARGVARGSLVALSLERSPDRIAALLGILKAGAAYWALEDNIPAPRLRLMLEDGRPAVLVVRQQTLSDWPTDLVPLSAFEDLLALPATSCANRHAPSASAEDPAYVNYTSGSTGQPKGVLVPHRGVVRLVRHNPFATLTAQDTLLHHSPLSFDASTFEIWGALLNGGCVALPPVGPLSLADMGEAIRQHRVTTLWLTAGLFHLMVDEKIDDLKPLRQLLAGGDVLSPAHVKKARSMLPGCRLINGYGPTENTTFTCCHTITDATPEDAPVPIGRPIANTRVYILDPLLQPVPVGVAGELYTGGDGLALAYLNQPQLTAERFIPDPFRPGSRLYRTGDGARWRADGELEFLGRLDSQVKIRGYRVELGEIEAVLREVDGVRTVAVLCRPNPGGGKWIVAYVVADRTTPADALGLKSIIREKLPGYMVPDVVQFLPALPLTANGKIDHRALPELAAPQPVSSTIEPPRNFIERQLLLIWRVLFQRKDIGIEDNFFDLGGHSLLATRLAMEIEKITHHRLPISAMLQAPTIAQLAVFIYARSTRSQFSSLVTLQPKGELPALFCIHGRGGDVYTYIHLARQLAPDRPVYGLQAVDMNNVRPRHTSVEAMAIHYAAEIRRQQPHGPYHLIGYSMGGWIAYAVAHELTRQGAIVGLLALIETGDTAIVPFRAKLHAQILRSPKILQFHLRHAGIYARRNLATAGRVLRAVLRKLSGEKPIPPVAPVAQNTKPDLWSLESLQADHCYQVVTQYRPPPYSGKVDLFIGDDSTHDKRVLWKYLIPDEVTLRQVAGEHLDLLKEDKIATFGTTLRRAIQEAENRPHA